MSYVGAHIASNPKYLLESAKYLKELGGNMIQIFVDPIRVSKKAAEYGEFKRFIKDNNMRFIVHASYTINLSREWDTYSAGIQQFITEIIAASELGASGIVVHMGKQMELSKEEAFNNMYMSLIYVHDQTKKTGLKILLETSTGQGSEICYNIEEFAYFFRKLSKNKNKDIANRFGVCVDTCHIFTAGYDITTKAAVYLYIETFEELIGLRYIFLIHLNDSKKEIGSNVDRHENIGHGYIGKIGLLEFAKYFKNLQVPIVLETPGRDMAKDLELLVNIAT